MRYALADMLDRGERDLLAHALQRSDVWFLCGPDLAAMRAMHALGLLDRAVSLEYVARLASARLYIPLKTNYSEQWLTAKRTQLKMDDVRRGKASP